MPKKPQPPATNGKAPPPVDLVMAEVQAIFPELEFTEENAKRKMLSLWHLMQNGRVDEETKACGVGRTTSWLWRVNDPAFAAAAVRCKAMGGREARG